MSQLMIGQLLMLAIAVMGLGKIFGVKPEAVGSWIGKKIGNAVKGALWGCLMLLLSIARSLLRIIFSWGGTARARNTVAQQTPPPGISPTQNPQGGNRQRSGPQVVHHHVHHHYPRPRKRPRP